MTLSFSEGVRIFIDTLRENSSVIYGESNSSEADSVLEYRPLKSQYFKLHMGFEDAEDILFGLNKGIAVLN